MRCKDAQKWILRSLDGALPADVEKAVGDHAAGCAPCAKVRRDYAEILGRLKAGGEPEPLPYFWTRLESRIREEERQETGTVWLRWSRRAIPVSLLLIGFFIGAIAFLSPAIDEEMGQAEALLLRNANPLAETNTLFDEQRNEDKSMMIMFAGNEQLPSRRYMP